MLWILVIFAYYTMNRFYFKFKIQRFDRMEIKIMYFFTRILFFTATFLSLYTEIKIAWGSRLLIFDRFLRSDFLEWMNKMTPFFTHNLKREDLIHTACSTPEAPWISINWFPYTPLLSQSKLYHILFQL